MNIKKIMSFIALAMVSSTFVFANINDENPSEKFTKELPNTINQEKNSSIIEEKTKNLPIEENKKKNSFAYLNLQTIYYLPEIGFGYRHKATTIGYDLNFALDPILTTAMSLPIGTINASLLNYFNSKNNSNYYIGIGVMGSFPLAVAAPHLCFGKQFEKSFVQLKVHFPTYYIENGKPYGPLLIPIPSLSIGFGF